MNILTYENISSLGGVKNIEIHIYYILYATSYADNPRSRLWRVYSRFTEVIVDIIVHRAVNFSPATIFKRNSWLRCTYYACIYMYVCMYVELIQKLSHTYITTRVYRLTFYANSI